MKRGRREAEGIALAMFAAVPLYFTAAIDLTSLALDKVNLSPQSSDLNHVIQVFLGEMDHKHSPLRSTGRVKGLAGVTRPCEDARFLQQLHPNFARMRELLEWLEDNHHRRVPTGTCGRPR